MPVCGAEISADGRAEYRPAVDVYKRQELKVFTVRKGDLPKFTQEAKKYGVLYCVLADRKNKDPNAEVEMCIRDSP